MRELFRGVAAIAAGLLATTIAWSSAMAQAEPPTRVGRLAFVDGTVSFHDDRQAGWDRAIVNTPLTSGDALWTEPGAHSEISVAGTRVRLDGATQLDMLALDDTQTRLQLAQGRIDIKTFDFDTRQPYQIVTPRGTISLQQQGDYYVEAGSTEDATRLGVRSGAAQIESLNGQVLAVRAGEVGEVLGDSGMLQLRTIRTAPPAPPAYWAARDRQIVYAPPQYVSAGMVGYEDLNAYGDWMNDGSYGRVWVPRAVPSGWAPYRTGHWAYVEPWGWTWIDEQPWGFAPYHYGRWANSRGRWVWVPPQREPRPVYAPALVGFMGGIELAATLANAGAAPVGWFPLGPREVYVPPYTTNRDYYRRLNRSARIDDRLLEERWQRAQRQDSWGDRRAAWANQRFATVVPSTAFVRSQPVMRAALQVAPEKVAAAPVAPIAAPPAPTASMVSTKTAPAAPGAATPDPKVAAESKSVDVPVARTAVAAMPALARPASDETRTAPGPKTATVQPQATPDSDKRRPANPPLAPRQGTAPPELKGAVTPAPAQPSRQQQPAPQPQPQARGPEPPKPVAPPAAAPTKPAEPPTQQAAPAAPAPQPQARPDQPRPPAPAPQQQTRPEPPRQAEPPRQQAAPQAPAPQPQARPEQPRPPAPAPQQQTRPEPPRQAEPPRQQAAPQAPAPQPQARPEQPRPPAPAPQQQARPEPPRQAEPPRQQAAPQPQRPAPPPQQASPPPQQQAPQRQAAPPQQQPQPAPPKSPEQAQSPKPGPQQRGGDDKK